jgi:DNA-binding NarL/FixJ family response regulator
MDQLAQHPLVRVLAVVEDHPDMQVLLRILLHRDRGFDVLAEATCGDGALAAVSPGCGPGVIVLDQDLDGDLTGLELAPRLKERAPDARIVLFTAHDLASEVAASAVIDRFVRKDQVAVLPSVLRSLAQMVDLTAQERREDVQSVEG